jgi:hypothetical protein
VAPGRSREGRWLVAPSLDSTLVGRNDELPCDLTFPVDAKVTVDKKGQLEKKTAFYIRLNNGTVELDQTEKQKYISTRWPS